MPCPRALAIPFLLATLGACASLPSVPSTGTASEAALPTTGAAPQPVILLGPTAASLIGGSIADLEIVTGPPALVRTEGQGEFRRYDLTEGCRAFAVVSLPDRVVADLSTGPAVRGRAAPAFEECTAKTVMPPLTGS